MIAEADLQNMTKAEKLETISPIWDSLEEDIEPPAWHQEIIEERLRRMDAGGSDLFHSRSSMGEAGGNETPPAVMRTVFVSRTR